MIHVGDDFVVRAREIVMMVDLAHADLPDTHAFLSSAQEAGKVQRVSQDTPKTAVVTCTRLGQAVYLSPISSATLLKRMADFS